MDGLGLENLLPVTNTLGHEPYRWTNVQHRIGSSTDHIIIHSKMASHSEGSSHPGIEFQGNKICNTPSNAGRAYQILEQLTPALDTISVAPSVHLLQKQEAIRPPEDNAVARSGAGVTWGEVSNAELCSFPHTNRPYIMSPLNGGAVENFTTGLHHESIGYSVTNSFDSHDFFLPATSNTDTSLENDAVIISSNSRNLWSFSSSSVVLSGGSENNSLNQYKQNDFRQANEPPNITLPLSSSSSPIVKHAISSVTRPNSFKRSKEEQELKMSSNYQSIEIQSDSSTNVGGFRLITENPSKHKKPRLEKQQRSSSISFQQSTLSVSSVDEPDVEAIAQIKEMIYREAAFRPVNFGLEVVEKPKRRNVKISSDPQTAAARERRERVSERIRVLQRLVPGGSKMDTASVLDEAANYLKFLKSQVKALEAQGHKLHTVNSLLENGFLVSTF